MHELVYTNGK